MERCSKCKKRIWFFQCAITLVSNGIFNFEVPHSNVNDSTPYKKVESYHCHCAEPRIISEAGKINADKAVPGFMKWLTEQTRWKRGCGQ